MTKQRQYGEDTPLNNWIRSHPALDSRYGYVGTDVDLTWYNYDKAFIMLLEHKERMGVVGPSQEATLAVLDQALTWGLSDPSRKLIARRYPIPERVYYCGLHTIRCENTSPLDGAVYIDDVKVTQAQFLQFLQFEWTPTIKVYYEQKDRLLNSHTPKELTEAASFVATTVYKKHPEIELLRDAYRKKKDELVGRNVKQHLKQEVNIKLAQIQQLQSQDDTAQLAITKPYKS